MEAGQCCSQCQSIALVTSLRQTDHEDFREAQRLILNPEEIYFWAGTVTWNGSRRRIIIIRKPPEVHSQHKANKQKSSDDRRGQRLVVSSGPYSPKHGASESNIVN